MGTSRCEKRIDSLRRSLEKPDLLSSGVDVEGGHGIIGGLFADPCEWIGAPAKGTNMWNCQNGFCCAPPSITPPFFDCAAAS
jgi:hypothetical protein